MTQLHLTLADKFTEDGYVILRGVLCDSEIHRHRQLIDREHRGDHSDRLLFCRNFSAELTEAIREIVLRESTLDGIRETFSKISKKKLFWMGPFNIAKNYLPHSWKTPFGGWHRDCNGELKYSECRALLNSEFYAFAKFGLYYQSQGDYGGGITVIPGSHRYRFKYKRDLSGHYLKIRLLNFLTTISRKLLNISFINGKLQNRFLGAIDLDINAGDVAIFDSRLLHRGTFANAEAEKKIQYTVDSLHAHIPESQTKYVFYGHIGNHIGLESYLIDRNNRTLGKESTFMNADTHRLNGESMETIYDGAVGIPVSQPQGDML